jgi:hypothetical protein
MWDCGEVKSFTAALANEAIQIPLAQLLEPPHVRLIGFAALASEDACEIFFFLSVLPPCQSQL